MNQGKKPTQAERIAELEKAVRTSRRRINVLEGRLNADIIARNALETPPPSPVTPQPTEETWVPKVGDLVVPIVKSANGHDETDRVMPVQEYDNSPHDYSFRVHLDDADDENRWYLIEDIRPATEIEVSAHLQAIERAKHDELQPHDHADLSAEQRAEVAGMGLKLCTPRTLEMDLICWSGQPNGEVYGKANNFEDSSTLLSGDEWIRRARGTAARRERERQEAEAKKPLEFAKTRVRLVDHTSTGREGLWLFQTSNYHKIAFAATSTEKAQTMEVLRSEFTVLIS